MGTVRGRRAHHGAVRARLVVILAAALVVAVILLPDRAGPAQRRMREAYAVCDSIVNLAHRLSCYSDALNRYEAEIRPR